MSEDNPQLKEIERMYDSIALVYDVEYEERADYQAPKILTDLYKKYQITNGSILDIGCGTGKLKKYLRGNFTYSGIDLSSNMIKEAESRGYKGYLGPTSEIIKTFSDKSFDHVVAMSSLYFMPNFNLLIDQIERVAKKSYFITLEQFDGETLAHMDKKGIKLYNHSRNIISNPTEIVENVFLWKRPGTAIKIFGDVLFKIK
jgi:predicted TPR repeat methyltransferase